MSDEFSVRPGRARRRTNTAPEPILGDLERERWRASFAAVRPQPYRFPRSSLPVELETDAVIAELEASGPALAPGLAARIAAMGPRIASQLLDLVEREASNGGERPHSGALHALVML